MSKALAGVFVALVVGGIWAFVEWRAQPPPPPAMKPLPWETTK